MARLEMPLARATNDMPPRPWATLSAAAHSRRARSSSHASNWEKRCLISLSLATRTFYVGNGLIATLILLQSLSITQWVQRRSQSPAWAEYAAPPGQIEDPAA